ncbi:hypothetical protein I4U23_015304 [Adineta vaga]|nr:hypothetical protein I4U23_015304 [Adineta vaga]
MYILIRLCLTITIAAALIHCQGARGGGGGGSRGGGSSYRGGSRTGGSRCTGDDCNRAGIIAGSVIGGIFGLLAIIFGSIFCYRRCKGKPSRTNSVFVAKMPSDRNQPYSKASFQTGMWSSRYHQYNRWHGPHQLSLTFDSSMLKIDGNGTDDVGEFTITGLYSFQTNRMTLDKLYKSGTGNIMENFGHKVTIQLDWNAELNQFEGTWYVQTKKYRGEDKFELKLNQAIELSDEKLKY